MDTSVWSLALRRAKESRDPHRVELQELIREGRATLIGPIRQEVLSGVRTHQQFELLRDRLRAFPDIVLEAADHEDAADFYNRCRARGVQGSNTDLLICAVGARRRIPILTTDKDFRDYARLVPALLHEPR